MNDSISVSNTNNMAVNEWQVRLQMAQVLLDSGFLPRNTYQTLAQVLAIMMYGDMLGIPPMAALTNINVIQGKPTIPPQLMLALVYHTGKLDDIEIKDDGQACTVVMKRTAKTAHTTTFSQNDAAKMKLAGKDNWEKQPAVMRQWRAVAAACRIVFPDIIMGFYTPDEMGAEVAIDATGSMTYNAPIVVDPDAEVKRIVGEWLDRWHANGAKNGDLSAALGVVRWGDYDWLADGAGAKADATVAAYLAAESGKTDAPEDDETIEDAPVPETATDAPKKALTDSEIAKPWASAWYERGASFEDILAALNIDRLAKFDWKADGAIAKADALMKAYKAEKAAAKKAQKPSTPIGKVKTAAKGIGDSSAEPPDTENELEKAFPREYDKNTDASRL